MSFSDDRDSNSSNITTLWLCRGQFFILEQLKSEDSVMEGIISVNSGEPLEILFDDSTSYSFGKKIVLWV